MDFLNPKKQRRSRIILGVGYVLIAAAIGIGTTILLYQAYGFGFGKDGQIIQNGLVFVSSQPNGANIYVDGRLYKSQTNTRMFLPSGMYQVKISAAGYRDWYRQITVNGGDVQHFVYPFLFPQKLQTSMLTSLTTTPDIVTQSPDHRWLLVEKADDKADFDMYDLKKPEKPVQTSVSIPAGDYTPGDGVQSWSVVEWSTDNRRVLLLHSYTAAGQPAHEYVLFDRQTPQDSVNVTKMLDLPAAESLSLFNKKYDQYYAFDQAAGTLRTTSLTDSLAPEQLTHILAFKSYGNGVLLYATDQPPTGKAEAGKVSIVLQQGQKTYTLRTFPAGAPGYILNLATYSGDWYVAAGTTNGQGVYLYKNPQSQTDSANGSSPAAWRYLRITNPTYANFSANTQFIAVESGQQFVVYDAENIKTYHYTASLPLDQPQAHASWMDGDRLLYVSGGKLVVFDYDNQNQQVLQLASPSYTPSFDPSYKYSFVLAPGKGAANPLNLTSTPLTVVKQ